ETVERFLTGLPDPASPRIFVFPGTSPAGAHRRWKRGRLTAALEEIRDRAGATLLIGWGPAEEEIARDVAAAVEGAIPIPPTSIKELMILMSRCDAYLGMHTGPMHLAALVGTPVVAVFGDRSDPRIHAPADHLESRVIADPEARELRVWQRWGLGPFEGPEPGEVVEATLETLERGERRAP
ncbi:MAG: glycosyltransferase family 9 protein, partial [Gemmatimonadota bacterium]|nr:glycosyltransferase family 9 protein [Gemmatimonadota bacterium]